MAKTLRIHNLAKELGVKSKFIVEKCQAEGLDIKNHMSTISAGLAATIREWFSEGEHTTTVETAKRVDLKKARIRKKKKAQEKAAKQAAEKAASDAKASETASDETVSASEMVAEPEAPAGSEEAESQEAAEDTETEQKEAKAEKPADQDSGPRKVVPKERPKPRIIKPKKSEEKEDESIIPAGPKLEKPKPAALSGPKVVRVEKIEPEEKKRPRKRGPRGGGRKSSFDQPIAEPLMDAMKAGPVPDKPGGKRGKGRKDKKDKDNWDDERSKKTFRRMRSKDFEERQARLAAARGESLKSRPSRKIETKKSGEHQVERPERAHISEPITVKDLSSAIAVRTGEIIAKLMAQGVMATANQVITTDVAELISMEFGTELIVDRKESIMEQIQKEFDGRESKNPIRRPPIVTMLGHVDHGKTSLLDKIRKSSVAEQEAGGITQHIGAYQIELNGKRVTFLDTPGHEAFTEMRSRGANMTDIVVLVVAADDGLMPQTVEAIHHVKAAEVEMIVAINKIDLPGTDINRIYGQLAEHELTPTEWGGNTEIVKTSAISGEGIEDLIEHLDYMADLKEYKADPEIPATGWVIEAKMTTTQGAVATLLPKEGSIKKGDTVLAGKGFGRIRTMKNSMGKTIKKAGSSDPVEISGLSDVPQAGDRFFCMSDLNRAKQAAEELVAMEREESLAKRNQISLDNLFSEIEAGNVKELNLIIRGDVQGSVDVLIKYLTDLSTEEVKIKILHAAVGGITEGDVVLSEASSAIIIGFNVVPDEHVRSLAESKGIDIRLYNVIYKITEDVKNAMSGMLEPDITEETVATLEVRNTFKVSGVGTIAGCFVKSGSITRRNKLRLIRDNIVIKDSCTIESLKHFKDDVREVKSGLECGVKVANFDDIKIGDVIEAYEIKEVARTID